MSPRMLAEAVQQLEPIRQGVLLDSYAGQAMQALIPHLLDVEPERVAFLAWGMAEAMLRERARQLAEKGGAL